MATYNLPSFYEDLYYKKTQPKLLEMGTDITSGKLPSFFEGLGKTGSSAFQNMLNLLNTKTKQAVNENLVRRNISRSGVGTSAIAKAVADTTANFSWKDYLKASKEKMGLLGTGLDTLSGVRGTGLDFMGQKNRFNLENARNQFAADKYNEQLATANKRRKNALWSNILSSGLGALGSAYGAYLGSK